MRLVCAVKRCWDFFAFTGHYSPATRHSPLFSPTVRPPNYRQRLFVEHDLGEPSASAVAAAAGGYSAPHPAGINMLRHATFSGSDRSLASLVFGASHYKTWIYD